MIKAIFFDLHGVVTHGNFKDVYHNVAQRLKIATDLVTTYHRENLPDMLTGAITPAHMLLQFGLENKMSPADMLSIWEEEILKLIEADTRMLSLLQKLKSNYVLGALTNLTQERYQADVVMGLYDYFDFTILSFQQGVKKPDPVFFEKALATAGVVAQEVLFIDDQEKNTKAANDLDIQSIIFTNYEVFIQDLNRIGIET